VLKIIISVQHKESIVISIYFIYIKEKLSHLGLSRQAVYFIKVVYFIKTSLRMSLGEMNYCNLQTQVCNLGLKMAYLITDDYKINSELQVNISLIFLT